MINPTQNTTMSPIFVLRDILRNEMDLTDDRVFIYNQKYTLPTDDGIFIVLSFMGSKIYSNSSKILAPTNSAFRELKTVHMMESYDISIFSRNTDAIFRKEEMLMALASQYSQELQERYGHRIFPIPNLVDASEVEATARLYRFSLTTNVLAWYSKTTSVDYFDKFTGEVLEDNSRINIEFEQPNDT